MSPLLDTVVLFGLVSGGAALLFRALPWPRSVTDAPGWFWSKFWGCVTCAAGRPAFVFAAWLWWTERALPIDAFAIFLGATGIGAVMYAIAGPPAPLLPPE